MHPNLVIKSNTTSNEIQGKQIPTDRMKRENIIPDKDTESKSNHKDTLNISKLRSTLMVNANEKKKKVLVENKGQDSPSPFLKHLP